VDLSENKDFVKYKYSYHKPNLQGWNILNKSGLGFFLNCKL
jgi:hypothetical protein